MADVLLQTLVKLDLLGNAPPSAGSYNVGDRVWNSTPQASGFVGWVCVTAGAPGTWKGFGVVES